MRAPVLLALTCFAGAAGAQDSDAGPEPSSQRLQGPSLVCSYAFGLRLEQGEYIDRQEGPDFALYHTESADGPFLLYEGNHPQPNDDEIRTGLDFPSVIAIHDGRSAEAKARNRVRDRLLLRDAFAEACQPAG